MSRAEATREAAREHPFVLLALRAGVLNHAAAARFLDVEGEEGAVATALRRLGEDLDDFETERRDVRVAMESGLGRVEAGADAPLAVGGTAFAPGEGSLTGVVATGAVDPTALGWVLARLDAAEVAVEAAGVAGEALIVVVERRAGASALRAVEAALESVPTDSDAASTV